ncbi:MAG TPA: TetR/AcrR family transcriptional regulator C-terminal domain-containing protein [Trebonia sp.]
MSTGSFQSPDASIWARPEPAARQPRFSRDQIAAAALAIADAEGFRAVSMRRVAARLGSGTMSLYRYISTKDDLMALMDDALMAQTLVPDGELPADWRTALAMIARRTRAVYLRHPWAARALPGEPGGGRETPIGPNGLRHAEQSLAAIDTAPFDTRGKLDLLAIVDDYVSGHVLRAAASQARPAVAAGDRLEQRFDLGLSALIDGAFRAWAYPGT